MLADFKEAGLSVLHLSIGDQVLLQFQPTFSHQQKDSPQFTLPWLVKFLPFLGKNTYVYYLFFPLDSILVFLYFLLLRLRGYRFRMVFFDPYYFYWLLPLLKRVGLYKFAVYFAADWFAGTPRTPGVNGYAKHLLNNVVHPLFDKWMSQRCDLTLNASDTLREARKKFYSSTEKVEFVKEEMTYHFSLKSHSPSVPRQQRKHILFFGYTRGDSGLELLLPFLKVFNEQWGTKLIIYGPERPECYQLKDLFGSHGIGDLFEYRGFAKDKSVVREASGECFCGINLITSSGSYSVNTIPSKIYEYWQMGLPCLVTENVGFLAARVRDEKAGILVQPDSASIKEGCEKVFSQFEEYQKNVEVALRRSVEGSSLAKWLVARESP